MRLKLRFTPRAARGLARIVKFNRATGEEQALAVVELIRATVSMLRDHPYLGRPVDLRLRELVISHGRTGYVALYSVDEAHRWVSVLAVRHQREAGFTP